MKNHDTYKIISLIFCIISIISSLFILYIKAPKNYVNAIPTLTEKIAMATLIISICLILSIFIVL